MADTTTEAKKAALAAAKTKLAETIAAHRAAAATRASDAEAARQAGLTAAQKLAEDREALTKQGDELKSELAKERQALISEARRSAATTMGILPKALALAPDVDPRTPEGAKALETWAKENPEFVVRRGSDNTAPPAPLPESNIAKILSGAIKHPFITAAEVANRLASQTRE